MLTDAEMWRLGETMMFPGHVFVLVKRSDGSYSLHQSYIGHYDISGDSDSTRGHDTMLTRGDIRLRLEGLHSFFKTGTWTPGDIAFWKLLTNVSSPEYLGYSKDGILLCYRRVRARVCTRVLHDLVLTEYERVRRAVGRGEGAIVYGDPAKYCSGICDVRPLTNSEMKRELRQVARKLGLPLQAPHTARVKVEHRKQRRQ